MTNRNSAVRGEPMLCLHKHCMCC